MHGQDSFFKCVQLEACVPQALQKYQKPHLIFFASESMAMSGKHSSITTMSHQRIIYPLNSNCKNPECIENSFKPFDILNPGDMPVFVSKFCKPSRVTKIYFLLFIAQTFLCIIDYIFFFKFFMCTLQFNVSTKSAGMENIPHFF